LRPTACRSGSAASPENGRSSQHKRLIVVRDKSVPDTGLAVVEQGVGQLRSVLFDEVRNIEAELAIIDRELKARGWKA
jgi:hypothetical protein